MSNKPYPEQPELHTRAEHRAAVLTYPGNLQEAIRQAQADPKKTLFGIAQGIPSSFLTKVYASAKPDFVWIDVEHGIFDRSTLYDCIHAAQHHSEGKTMVIARVPKHDEISLATALDAGAAGIIFPHVESADDVREMVKRVYYPPIGQRSFSPWTFTPGISDASLYAGDGFNMTSSNRHVSIIPQVESVKGIENVEEIAAVPGVSALMLGPGDFSADAGIEMKVGGEPHPTLLAAITKLADTARRNGKPLFGPAQGPEMIPMMVELGYVAIAVAFDVWAIAGLVHDSVKAARAVVGKDGGGQGKNGGEQGNAATDVVEGQTPPS